MATHLYLIPHFVASGEISDFVQSNRTVSLAVSPRANTLAIFATPLNPQHRAPAHLASHSHEKDIYFVGWDQVEQERRKFMSESYLIFCSLVDYNSSRPKKDSTSIRIDSPHIAVYSKHAQEYIELMVAHLNRLPDDPSWTTSRIRFERMYTSFELFHILYLPSHGIPLSLVGRELLQWLNTNIIAARNEDGIALLNLDHPWEHPDFWSYLARCTIRGFLQIVSRFLNIVCSKHTSGRLQQLCTTMIPILETYPSSEDFNHDTDFFAAVRATNARLDRVRKELNRVSGQEKNAGWYDDFSDIVSILEGSKEVISRLCTEGEGAGWIELVCVWGVWVHPGLTREELPDVCAEIFEELPPDPTLTHEVLQAGLFSGDAYKAALHANELDPWLGAHLADLMGILDLFDNQPDPSFTLRHHFLLNYAEHVLSDPSFWRIAFSYMDACGEIGLARIRELITRMPLELQAAPSMGPETNGSSVNDGTLKAVLDTCDEYRLDDVKYEICRTAVRGFISQRLYGKAMEYCAMVFDLPTLGQVVDALLEEYLAHGPQELVELVNQIPSFYLYGEQQGSPPSAFSGRLRFLVRFTEFYSRLVAGETVEAARDLVAMFTDEVAPRYWWGILLVEAGALERDDEMVLTLDEIHELLRRLEEVVMAAGQGAGSDYLGALQRRSKDGEKNEIWALQQLQVVRLALARYLGHSATIAVGGKGLIVAFE